MNPATAFTLLDIILRESTNQHEADNAKRQLSRMVGKAGSAPKLFGAGAPATFSAPPITSFNEARRERAAFEEQIAKLVALNKGLEDRVSKLVVENAKLMQENEIVKAVVSKTKASPDGTMAYNTFAATLKPILGNNWKVEFSRQTGVKLTVLDQARVSRGFVSKAIVDLIPTLKAVSREMFSPEQVRFIRPLAAKNMTDTEIAEQVSVKYGTVYTADMIVKLRVGLRVGARNKDGLYGDKAYGGELPRIARKVVSTRANENREQVVSMVQKSGQKGIAGIVLKGTLNLDDHARRVREAERANLIFKVGSHYVHADHKDAYRTEWSAHLEDIATAEFATFDAFREKACAALDLPVTNNGKTGWQTAFENQTNTPHSRVQQWLSRNEVPEYAMRACETLIPAQREDNIAWTIEMEDFLWGMSRSHKVTQVEMAERMAKRFGGHWRKNMIAGKVSRLKMTRGQSSQSI